MKNYLKNTDFYSSAYLITKGYECLTIETVDEGWSVFIFQRTPDIEKTLGEYFSDRGAVNPSQFVKEIKMLKTKIHNRNQNQRKNYVSRKDNIPINQ